MKYVLLIIFIANFLSCSNSTKDIKKNKYPNIILITSEDHDPDLSCYGSKDITTPNLDKLAKSGFQFNNAYITQAGCSQSRASIFTGLYPHQNGQIGLATHNLKMFNPETPNIFSYVKSAGYRTSVIGKIHVNPESAFPIDIHEKIKGGFKNRDVTWIAKTARQIIDSSSQPLFLMINYTDAHRPFIRQNKIGIPKNPISENDIDSLTEIGVDHPYLKLRKADYLNCILRLDYGIGLLMDELEKSGKRQNTIVIYLSDHGQDILRGKRTSYESGVKVPFIVSYPGIAKEKQKCNRLVSSVDILPTILDLSGVEIPKNLPGKSLIPVLKGDRVEWRDYLFTEFHMHSPHNYYPQRTVRDKKYKLIENLLEGEINPGYDYTINRFYKKLDFPNLLKQHPEKIQRSYAIMKQPPKYELYDLEKDPNEFNNLADNDKFKEILERLANVLNSWRVSTKDPFLDAELINVLKSDVNKCFDSGKYTKLPQSEWDFYKKYEVKYGNQSN